MTPADTAHSAVIRDHPFEPRDPSKPWGKCKHCWGFEGTHESTNLTPSGPRPPYRCPRCVETGQAVCTHAPEVVNEFLTKKEPPKEEIMPNPLPVAEIDLSEMQEHVVKEGPMVCWKCGTRDGVRKIPQNGAILCANCEGILKP